MSRHPRTKIVCTLGPASTGSADALRGLMTAGMNVARLNFSHSQHAQHAEVIRMVRESAESLGVKVAILGDLQGPRIRVGKLPEPMQLVVGMDIVLVPEGGERDGDIPITYEALATDISVGDRILLDDGLLEAVVLDVTGARVTARVMHGGILRSNKGMNLPGIHVSAPSITDKDQADIAFAIEQELDYLALSFVRRPEDIAELRAMVPREMLIISKIEKDVALENIEGIVDVSDGVMVARGDLGVELPFEEVPIAQKRIISVANRRGRPVITATQMLESMVTNPRPTRAEASDVANAILDGTDAVMLSAETAAGAFPRLAVDAMRRIITEIESHPPPQRAREERGQGQRPGSVSTEHAIGAATVAASKMLDAPLVMVFTKSGFTARIISSHRPDVPILGITDEPRTCRQLALVWGVIPVLVPKATSYDEMAKSGLAAAQALKLVRPGDRVIVTAGVPFDSPGTTNMLKVVTV